MPIVGQGSDAILRSESRNGAGQLQDAASITLTLKDSAAVTQSGFPVVAPAIVHDGIGLYHYTWSVPIGFTLGTYTAVWESIINSTPAVGNDIVEVTPAGSISFGREFMVDPDDYDAVRGLLGVTTLDVENSDIDLAAFAPQAELEVMRRISNWSAQQLVPDQLYVLRLATIYKTACLLAESFVRGGTIGLVRPLATGEGRDWAAAAMMFCSRFDYWINIADQSDDSTTDSNAIFTINPVRVGGPTRWRIAHRRSRVGTMLEGSWLGFPPYWDWRG